MLLVDAATPTVEEVYQVGLGIVIVGHDGGEGEEEQRHGDDHVARLGADDGTQSADGVEHAGLTVGSTRVLMEVGDDSSRGCLHHRVDDVVCLASQYHQGCGGTHQQGVDIDRETLHQALFDGMAHLCGGSHDGSCPLPCLVAVDAAFHTPRYGAAQQRAAHFVDTHGTTEHLHEDIGHYLPVDHQHHDGEQDVEHGHERRHNLRHVGNTFHSADDDHRYQQRHQGSHHPCRHTEAAGTAQRDAVALHRRQEDAASQCRQHREDGSEERRPQSFLDIVGWTTAELSVVVFLVNLCQSGLDKSAACTKEGYNPHPHDGSRAAKADGCSHTDDIACAHTTRQRHGERLKRRDAGFLAFVAHGAEQQSEHLAETTHLDKACPYRKIQSRQQAQADQCRAPHPSVDCLHYRCQITTERFHGCSYCFFCFKQKHISTPDCGVATAG